MKGYSRLALYFPLAFAGALWLAGTKLAAQEQPPYDDGPDPAAINQAPDATDSAATGPSYTTEAPPPDQYPDDANYAEQPTQQADQAPPPLPDYMQPPAPRDGYIWTPGYWAWGAYGYYWVPGVWVEPPYMGALWTPGYWRFYSGRYLWYPGHWGLHIGFYGGIHYGFGYVGFGYEGGYWRTGHFFYNRVYNHINERRMHNVYSYRANPHANGMHFEDRDHTNNNVHIDNHVRIDNNMRPNDHEHDFNGPRPSYRGGPNGVDSHPRPSEGAAWREPYAPRMNTQVRHEQNFGAKQGQYERENHGQPSRPAQSRPLHADRNVQPQPHGGGQPHGGEQSHGGGGHPEGHR